jgi:hypothetical protein
MFSCVPCFDLKVISLEINSSPCSSGLFQSGINFETMNFWTFGRTPWMGDRPVARPVPRHDYAT